MKIEYYFLSNLIIKSQQNAARFKLGPKYSRRSASKTLLKHAILHICITRVQNEFITSTARFHYFTHYQFTCLQAVFKLQVN